MSRTLPVLAITLALAALLGPALAQTKDAPAKNPLEPSGVGQPPPPAPVKPVTETLFGTPVTDNYRYMEALGPETTDWMKAQGAYTRRVLDSIRPLPALEARVAAFTGSFGLVTDYALLGGRTFYEERAPGSDNFDLIVREPDGATRKIVDIAALRAAHGGVPFAINYVAPSPDGSKVAVGISQGGSENANLFIYDAASGAPIAGPVDRARFGVTSWSNDSRTVYFLRLKLLTPGEPATDEEQYVTDYAWTPGAEPAPLWGPAAGRGPAMAPTEDPALVIQPTAPLAMLVLKNGVQNEVRMFTAPVGEAGVPSAHWTPFVVTADGVTSGDMRGGDIFLLSHKDAPTFQVLDVKAGQPLTSAKVLVPARPDRIIEGVHAAADALYVVTSDGVYSHLLRIPAGGDRIEEVALPVHGHVGEIFTDPREAGAVLQLSSWVQPYAQYRYDPASGAFTDLRLGVHGDIDPAKYAIQDLQAPAKDGVKVPLSIVQPKDAHGPQITVVEAYGSYGISELADFSARRAAMVREGITYGVCHVRGGGELGEAWRLGGKDLNKPNTWRDLIACGEDLIARGVTTKDKLFIMGGSAGGITMGRSMTERPDLFAGVIDVVPAANTLRAEFSANGPPNVPEFGTVANEQGFKDLLEMDSIQHVKPGVAYPPVIISTGLNDPRVSPWEPAKFAAALEAAGTPNPVLLRIDEQAGHGIGSTRTQTDRLVADWIAFVFWRAGVPEWRPEAAGR